MLKQLYKKHQCSLIAPLVFLALIDIIAFLQVLDDLSLVDISTRSELIIFTLSMSLTYYYLGKQRQNIRKYITVIKHTFKRWF